MGIEEAGQAAMDFLQRALGKQGAIVRIGQAEGGWYVAVEVIEPSDFVKALGLAARVLDRNVYEVRLNSRLEVVACKRVGQHAVAA
jgi:hypothetical protein